MIYACYCTNITFLLFSDIVILSFAGAESVILKMRNQLKGVIESERERYFATNALRNPFKDAELYILPMGVAAVAWVMAVLVNATCSTDFCERTEDTFVNIYLFILFCIIVLTWRHIQGALHYAKEVLLPLLLANTGAGAGAAAGVGAGADVTAGIIGNIAAAKKTN